MPSSSKPGQVPTCRRKGSQEEGRNNVKKCWLGRLEEVHDSNCQSQPSDIAHKCAAIALVVWGPVLYSLSTFPESQRTVKDHTSRYLVKNLVWRPCATSYRRTSATKIPGITMSPSPSMENSSFPDPERGWPNARTSCETSNIFDSQQSLVDTLEHNCN